MVSSNSSSIIHARIAAADIIRQSFVVLFTLHTGSKGFPISNLGVISPFFFPLAALCLLSAAERCRAGRCFPHQSGVSSNFPGTVGWLSFSTKRFSLSSITSDPSSQNKGARMNSGREPHSATISLPLEKPLSRQSPPEKQIRSHQTALPVAPRLRGKFSGTRVVAARTYIF